MKLLLACAAILATSEALKGFCDKAKPKIEVLMQPDPSYVVSVGDTVSIACAAHNHGGPEPHVYWTRGHGADGNGKGRNVGPVAFGKSVLYFEQVKAEDVDTYRCVIEPCCGQGKKQEFNVEITVPDNTCRNFYGLGNVIYWATWEFLSWEDAVKSCEDKGLELAFPQNAEENALLLEDVQASFNNHPNARKYAHENWLWIGAHDTDKEGDWVQQLTNEAVEWFNWQNGQPDDWKGVGSTFEGGQDCIGMNRGTGRWDDSFKHYKRPYACRCNKNKQLIATRKKNNKAKGI